MVELSGPSETRIPLEKVQAALRLSVGAASPLWFMFAGAATAGVAYRWMTRWTKRENLEALLGAGAQALEPPALASAEPRSFAPEPEAVVRETAAASELAAVAPAEPVAPEPKLVDAPRPEAPETPAGGESTPLQGAALVAEVARLTGLTPADKLAEKPAEAAPEPIAPKPAVKAAPEASATKPAPKKATPPAKNGAAPKSPPGA